MAVQTKYPECEKVKELALERETIGAFLEWLEDKGINLCEYNQEDGMTLQYVRRSKAEIIAEHLGIDLKKWEAEKQEILKQLRVKV